MSTTRLLLVTLLLVLLTTYCLASPHSLGSKMKKREYVPNFFTMLTIWRFVIVTLKFMVVENFRLPNYCLFFAVVAVMSIHFLIYL